MRHSFFLSILLTAVAATPLALLVVCWHWAHLEIGVAPDAVQSAARMLMRTFVVSFDLLVLLTWLPCAIWVSRYKTHLQS